MKTCHLLNEYLDGDLGRDSCVQFEQHLSECPACASKAQYWQTASQLIKQDAEDLAARHTRKTEQERQWVETCFEQQLPIPWWRPTRGGTAPVFAAAVAVVSLIIGGVLIYKHQNHTSLPLLSSFTIRTTYFHRDGTFRKITTPSTGTTVLSNNDERLLSEVETDLVALGPGGKLYLKEVNIRRTALVLSHGFSAYHVSKRKKNGRFVAHTADDRFTIEVKGTRFGIHYPAKEARGGAERLPVLQVAVTEGIVWVTERQNRRWVVSAGHQLTIDNDGTELEDAVSSENEDLINALLSFDPSSPFQEEDALVTVPDRPGKGQRHKVSDVSRNRRAPSRSRPKRLRDDAPPEKTTLPPVSLLEIKQWIVGGQCKKAIPAIEARLTEDGQNSELWRLLAECRRKNGRYKEAVTAYRKVIELAPPLWPWRRDSKQGSSIKITSAAPQMQSANSPNICR